MPSPADNLARALDNDEFALHYQTIEDSSDRRVISAEALLRWKRGDKEVGAEALASAAERGPKIFHLERWTMETAFRDANSWMSEGLDVRLNVNLSAREFQEGDLIAFFDEAVERTGVDPSRLNLELTEKSFIQKLKDVRKVLEELKTRGVQLWLDDFGTGHSSIEHLKEFPVDGIKIPGTYVQDITDNQVSRAITGSLVRLASDLGIYVVAEAVETDEQLAIVNDLGCFWIQGYLIKRPMPFESFREAVRNSCRRRWRE